MHPLSIVVGIFAYSGALTYGSLNFLPTTLLRLTPIVSSTASLIWAWDEHTSFSAFMDPAYRDKADALLPAWFKNWAKNGNYVLLTSFPVSWSVGLANMLSIAMRGTNPDSINSPSLWYGLGTLFAVGHMLFGARALGLLAEIQQKGRTGPDGKRASPTDAQGRWLQMHALRTPTTDLPALLCFLTGAFLALESRV